MSALAQIMHELGYNVQGSDLEKHFFTEDGLRELGIKILPFSEDNINKDLKIVKGASFNSENNVEVKKAEELDLDIYTYSEMVGKLTKKFKTICVAGCHGKTTTTSMFSQVLNEILGCNYLIGDGTGFANKENEFFALESCEYRRHFLNYTPYYAIITNIDLDHVDYFEDIDDVISAYQEFAHHATKMVIACGDDPYTRKLDIDKPIFYYGLNEEDDIRALNVEYKEDGISFEVEIEGNYYGSYDIPMYGKHNLLNALAVIGTCYYERIDTKLVTKAFKKIKGAKRRFTEIELNNGNIIIDDYAHHPNEIKATLDAIKQKYKGKKLVTIFQPHTYSRTKQFKDDLIEVFKKAGEVYILDIHGARENQEDFDNITSDIIIKELDNAKHLNMEDGNIFKDYKNTVFAVMSPNDLSKLEEDIKTSINE